jgi:hypothetical protein
MRKTVIPNKHRIFLNLPTQNMTKWYQMTEAEIDLRKERRGKGREVRKDKVCSRSQRKFILKHRNVTCILFVCLFVFTNLFVTIWENF